MANRCNISKANALPLEAEGVELIEEDYSLTEHRQLVQEDAFQCIVFADSGRSLKAGQVGPNQIQGDI